MCVSVIECVSVIVCVMLIVGDTVHVSVTDEVIVIVGVGRSISTCGDDPIASVLLPSKSVEVNMVTNPLPVTHAPGPGAAPYETVIWPKAGRLFASIIISCPSKSWPVQLASEATTLK